MATKDRAVAPLLITLVADGVDIHTEELRCGNGKFDTVSINLSDKFPVDRPVKVEVRFSTQDGSGLAHYFDGQCFHLMDEDGHVTDIAWLELEAPAR